MSGFEIFLLSALVFLAADCFFFWQHLWRQKCDCSRRTHRMAVWVFGSGFYMWWKAR